MKNFLGRIHKILGITLILPLLFMALTGITLVLFEVKNGWNMKQVEDVEGLASLFKKGYPEDALERISFAGNVKIRAKKNGERMNYILDEALNFVESKSALRKIAIDVHDFRFVQNGRQIVGVIGILGVLLCLFGFGLYFYQKNLSGKLALKPKNSASFYRNFHAIIAFRFGFLIVFIMFAGVVIAFPALLPVKKGKMEKLEGSFASLNEKTAFALKTVGKSALYEVSFKGNSTIVSVRKKGDVLPYIFHFNEGGVMLDNPQNYGAFTKFALSLPIIHKSKIGLWWAIMQILAGLLLVFLGLAGVFLWWKKKA